MGFQQGLSGLAASAKQLDVVGNNVANANTVGFKGSSALFADVYASASASAGVGIGIGTTMSAVQQSFVQGNITVTSNPLDVAINGGGFFRLDSNGSISYSRNGQFHLDKDGYIVNATGSKVTGFAVGATGTVVSATPQPLQISAADLIPTSTANASIVLNLDSREAAIALPFNINDAKTYNKATSMTVYDSLGNQHTLATYYVKTASNTWSVYGAADGTPLGAAAIGTLKFNSDGTFDLAGSTQPNISIALTNGASTPLTFPVTYTGSTQFGSVFGVNSLGQDGFASGKLAGYSLSAEGTILGRYTNGQSRALGQVVLANFSNPEGLAPLGNNQWGESGASGLPIVGTPGSASLGVVQSGAVENSNVDLTQELVDMITAQRIYQANAQTIKTQDQVFNTLVNLR
jgi:flagellar hook protein FlgE